MALADRLLVTAWCCLLSADLFTSAYIHGAVAEALLVRARRAPGRGMTVSGFFPSGGMSAYASSGGDYGPQWYRGGGGGRLRPAHYPEEAAYGWGQRLAGKDPQEEEEGLVPPPAGGTAWQSEGAAAEEDARNPPGGEAAVRPPGGKRPKKKRPAVHRPKEPGSEEEEDDDESAHAHAGSGGNAKASFNAWFPIMLGMFPPPSRGEEEGYPGAEASSRKARPQPLPPTTVIANSVSHGPGGVASSHAVAYGALPPPHQQSRQRR